MEPEAGPLHGYLVVDLSTGIAGAYCTKLLADGGATVVKVEPSGGDPLRRWSASGAEIPPDGDGALFSFLAGSKHSVVAEPDVDDGVEFVSALLAGADAVVWSRGSKIAEHGGLNEDDVHVALLISLPGMEHHITKTPVTNQQVAPTIIKALGFDPNQLRAVQREQTNVLPFLFSDADGD